MQGGGKDLADEILVVFQFAADDAFATTTLHAESFHGQTLDVAALGHGDHAGAVFDQVFHHHVIAEERNFTAATVAMFF